MVAISASDMLARGAPLAQHPALHPSGFLFPYAPCGPQLSALRAAHPLSAQGRMNRPLPGVCETQCPGCGVMTLGPRAGWTPAHYDPLGALVPVALNPIIVPRSAPCPGCAQVAREIHAIFQSARRRAAPRAWVWLSLLGLRPAVITYLLTQQGVAA